MNQQTKEIFLHIWDSIKWYLLTVLVTVLIFANCKGCASDPKPTTTIVKVDTITPKINKNKADIIALVDSAEIYKAQLIKAINRKNYYKLKYKSVYDSVYSASDSVCKVYLGLVQRVKLKQDSAHEAENQANSLIIVNAYNQIGEYKDNEVLYTEKIKQDSVIKQSLTTRIVQLIDTLPRVKRKGFIKGFLYGFGSGATAKQGVDLLSKVRP